jgi:hypothetical protein
MATHHGDRSEEQTHGDTHRKESSNREDQAGN